MKLQTLVVGPFEVNCYLYWDEKSGDGVVIDPGDDAATIIRAVEQSGMNLRAALLTHGHGDHIAAVSGLLDRFKIPLYVGEGDQKLLADPSANVSASIGHPIITPEPDVIVTDEQVIGIGSILLRVLATPGHTQGGVCYLDEKENLLFCGDTLFWGSIGRTDLPGGSLKILLNSIRSKILRLPDGIKCLPGHGPETTVGAERAGNPFLTDGFYA